MKKNQTPTDFVCVCFTLNLLVILKVKVVDHEGHYWKASIWSLCYIVTERRLHSVDYPQNVPIIWRHRRGGSVGSLFTSHAGDRGLIPGRDKS